jgi:hypothetical protein
MKHNLAQAGPPLAKVLGLFTGAIPMRRSMIRFALHVCDLWGFSGWRDI